MQIVVLDAYTENPGDLSWSVLESYGDLTIYDRTDPADETELIRKFAIMWPITVAPYMLGNGVLAPISVIGIFR